MLYFLSFIVLLEVAITKIYFLFSEGILSLGYYGLVSLLLVIIGIVICVLAIVKNRSYHTKKKTVGFGEWVFIFCIAAIIAFSFYLNFRNKSQNWDSVALYDARAKYLMGGTKFSQMVDLSRYDSKNLYYYSLYPPETSLIHYFWYILKIPLPVNIYYSLNLLVFAFAIFFFFKNKTSRFFSLIITFLTIGNVIVFSASFLGYTNLPYSLQMCLAVFFLYDYLREKNLSKAIIGIILLVGSQWIRFLEPIWVGIILAFVTALYWRERDCKKFIFLIPLIIIGLVEYMGWKTFTNKTLVRYQIVQLNLAKLFEPAFGIFTGSVYKMLIYFTKSFGLFLIIHLAAIISVLVPDFKKKDKNSNLFLVLTVVFSLMIYFAGLYFVSFQADWWKGLGGSLVRSSMFLIPISAFLIILGINRFRGKSNINSPLLKRNK